MSAVHQQNLRSGVLERDSKPLMERGEMKDPHRRGVKEREKKERRDFLTTRLAEKSPKAGDSSQVKVQNTKEKREANCAKLRI